MEIVPSNSENADRPRVKRGRKRKNPSLNQSNNSSSSSNSEAPPRAIGLDGCFYECVKCNEVGSLICCDTCSCTYHFECLDPPLESVPEGDWFCHNCSGEVDNLSDSTVNPKRRRRGYLKRACKVPSGCCLCSTIPKKLIPDENAFFSFKTKSNHQSNLSARNDDDGVGGTHIQHNNNNGDKRSVLRPRKRGGGNKIESRNTGKSTRANAAQPKKVQNVNNLPPRCRGGQHGKRTSKGPTVASQQRQPAGLAVVLHGENLNQEEVAAGRAAAEEAPRNKARETPWTEDEVDALWVGVRRHGPDNWDTILNDKKLRVFQLCKKTSHDLSMRWQKELEIMYSIVKTSGFSLLLPPPPPADQPVVDHTPEPAILSNEEATVQQQLPQLQIPVLSSAESAPLVPNHHPGSSSSSSSPSPLRPPVLSIPAATAAGEAERGPINQSTSQLQHVLACAGIPAPRAPPTFAVAPPPQWRPNLNLNPMANQLMFQAFQRTQMMNHVGMQAPRGGVAMAAQRPPANTNVSPTNLFIGGFLPVQNAYGGARPNNPAVLNRYLGRDR